MIQSSQAASEGTSEAKAAIASAQAVGIGIREPDLLRHGGVHARVSRNLGDAQLPGGLDEDAPRRRLRLGVYSSAASGITDLAAAYGGSYTEPDDIWIADWNGKQATSDPYVPAADWAAHQRLHQFNGGQNKTYGGITLNIDGDYLDGAVAGYGTGTVAPQFPDGTVLQDSSVAALLPRRRGRPAVRQ